MPNDPIVSTDWLESRLDDPNVRVLDIRGYVSTRPVAPGVEEATYRGAPEEFLTERIPGSAFVDWTVDIVDPDDTVPAQLAGPGRFGRAMSDRGVGNKTRVVAVDHAGGQYATRLWWALTYYGHESVAVLEGGWNRWVEEGRPTESGEPRRFEPSAFIPRPRPDWRASAEQVRDLIGGDEAQIVDARDIGQFSGARRRGPRGGHVPGALHVPRELFYPEGGGFLPIEEVKARALAAGLRLDRPVVAYCNGGVAATYVLFNLHRIGHARLTNYDGSWNEWGPRTDLPVET